MRLALLSLAALVGLTACGAKPEAETGDAPGAAAEAPAERFTLGGDGLPRFREGLWEVTEVVGGEREVTKHCAGAEVQEDIRKMLASESPNCKTDKSSGPLGIKLHAVCDQGNGLKTETDMKMSGSATTWNMTLGLYAITPDGKRNGGEATMRARWIGACPPGVQPGEDVED